MKSITLVIFICFGLSRLCTQSFKGDIVGHVVGWKSSGTVAGYERAGCRITDVRHCDRYFRKLQHQWSSCREL